MNEDIFMEARLRRFILGIWPQTIEEKVAYADARFSQLLVLTNDSVKPEYSDSYIFLRVANAFVGFKCFDGGWKAVFSRFVYEIWMEEKSVRYDFRPIDEDISNKIIGMLRLPAEIYLDIPQVEKVTHSSLTDEVVIETKYWRFVES